VAVLESAEIFGFNRPSYSKHVPDCGLRKRKWRDNRTLRHAVAQLPAPQRHRSLFFASPVAQRKDFRKRSFHGTRDARAWTLNMKESPSFVFSLADLMKFFLHDITSTLATDQRALGVQAVSAKKVATNYMQRDDNASPACRPWILRRN
jgi:hypothetical protein